MQIVHKLKDKSVTGQGSGTFFLSDKDAGYISLGQPNDSHYCGWHTFIDEEWELYKIIEDIKINTPYEKIVNSKNAIKRETETSTEIIKLEKNILTYSISNYTGHIELILDFRKIHDFSTNGRIYELTQEKDCILIEYSKYETNSLEKLMDRKYLAIKGNFQIDKLDQWIKREYTYDLSRQTKNDFYVFRVGNLLVSKEANIVFCFSNSKKEALDNCKKSYKKKKKEKIIPFSNEKDIAQNALDTVTKKLKDTKINRVFAGLPWFYQIWSRDELIALGGKIANEELIDAKTTLLKNLEKINSEGELGNRWPESDLASADGTGWLYKRISDLINNKDIDVFTKSELSIIYKKIQSSIRQTRKKHLKNGLIFNDEKETWMDTTTPEGKDSRAGYRIEIQALHLNMYTLAVKLATKLGKHLDAKEFKNYEKELINNIQTKLIKNQIIYDGLNENNHLDETLRPNVFLANYIYPELTSHLVWEKTFDLIIHECWLNWGGLSSISKNDPLFFEYHTGINNKSYHRGDSWFFINNIAAICLTKMNSKKYAEYIEKIKDASIKEMLFYGFIGQCAELSDAKELCSKGCRAQAWSASTLIELLTYKKDRFNK